MNKVKILVATHKPNLVYHDDVYTPIHVGKVISKYEMEWQGDNTGDNISEKNPMYCEMTAHYWAWKNLKDVNYIGLCHYQRYFETKITNDNIEELLNGVDVILPSAIYFSTAVEYNFRLLAKEDCFIFFKVIEEFFPEYYETAVDYILNNNREYAFNMLICSRVIYDQIMQFVFAMLFKTEKYIMQQPYTDGKRIYGYFSEFLIPIYCLKHKLRIKEIPVVQMLEKVPVKYVVNKPNLFHRWVCNFRSLIYSPHKRKYYNVSPSLISCMKLDGILDEKGHLIIR